MKENDDIISVEIPEDVTTLSDDALESLRQNARDAFAELNKTEKLSADEKATLRALKEAWLALDAESKRRAEDTAADDATRAELAALMSDPEPEAAEEAAEEAPAEVEAAGAPVETKAFAPINVARLKARQAPVEVSETPKPKPFRAGSGAAGMLMGAELDLDGMVDAVAKAQNPSGLNQAFRQAAAGGQRLVQSAEIAQFSGGNIDPELIVDGSSKVDFDSTHPAYKRATDQARLPGGSLTASGGWCAPSETIYDLCSLESADGLLSIPEVMVRRGGIRFTTGPDWADIFITNGFCFTEAEDIAGTYTTNEVQSLTEGGAGLTSFTLTFGGQTTASIPASATAAQIQAALEALSTIGSGNVYVTGPAGASTGPWNVTFVNALGNTNVAQMTSTPTGGSGTLTVATVTQGGGAAGTKPCSVVPCPTFTDVRLNVCGICVQSGILLNQAYPELVRRYVSGALVAHTHRVNTNVIASIVSQSTAVTVLSQPSPAQSAAVTLLSALELEAEDIRYRRRMARGSVMEVILPYWIRGALRKDFASRNTSANPYEVADADIARWFALRGISPQFVYDWQNLGAGNAAVAWPTSVQFVMYPAGTFVKGTSSLVTLNALYDSTLYANNNFTALFTEEGWSVMKMCPESRVVTVPLCYNGGAVLSAAPAVVCTAA